MGKFKTKLKIVQLKHEVNNTMKQFYIYKKIFKFTFILKLSNDTNCFKESSKDIKKA